LVLLIGLALSVAATWEAQTSSLQSWFFGRWNATLHYTIEPGPNPQMAFPVSGPFDERRGYTRIPEFRDSLEAHGYQITEQALQSPALAHLIRSGIAPPFREPPVTGLVIHDADGITLLDPTADHRVFRRFEDVPPLLVQTLLFIENRSIGDRAGPRVNPAMDWSRTTRALVLYAGRKAGLDLPTEGGSTLATQLEKYRHSPQGRTSSPTDKLRQMLSASLEAYHSGSDTREAREQIILDYLNTMPLAAAPNVGDVHGLGDGLRVWFAMDLANVLVALDQREPTPEKARAYRHALALLYAVHAPTHYLVRDRRALESRVDAYADLLKSAGVIDARLLAFIHHAPLEFAGPVPLDDPPPFVERKAVDAVRLELAKLLKIPGLYDLDRLNVRMDSTIDGALQDDVTQFLRRLASSEFVAANGLREPRTLARGDPRHVTYSFLLLESRPEGNFVRVRADTDDAPFDVNEGMKLELGSTAKLRTLAHYLDVMAQLHDELSPLGTIALESRAAQARDALTRWAALTLGANPGLDLETFLSDTLERQYSASPAEVFFTGGGIHRFRNFEPQDNGRVMSVREAVVHSTNLVFIRLMRDLVHFHEARLPYDSRAVLGQNVDPMRRQLLEQIADEDGRQVLARMYRRYQGLSQQEILSQFLNKNVRSYRSLAIIFYAWRASTAPHTDADAKAGVPGADALASWLTATVGKVTPDKMQRLERAYGNPRLTVADFGYLLNKNPLELWVAGELARNPQMTWTELLTRSLQARHIASEWLFKTRNRKAQDLRLRIRIERDAFARMTPYWRALGFPFHELVPSYATAIGSSADRPLALAELMGIIVNDGQRRPTTDIRRLGFAMGTPYHTVFEPTPGAGEPVMRTPIARILRAVLAEVVERGTAHRVDHAFLDDHGMPIRIGGKTGTGDNRIEAFARGGRLLGSHVVSRTAGFVFYVGDHWFGVITASVSAPQAQDYTFTSSLPLAVLKLLAPTLNPAIRREESRANESW
jgi:membrane peptidoglycan carboxypeptidase